MLYFLSFAPFYSLIQHPPPGISCWPSSYENQENSSRNIGDRLDRLEATIIGPVETPFAGGEFRLEEIAHVHKISVIFKTSSLPHIQVICPRPRALSLRAPRDTVPDQDLPPEHRLRREDMSGRAKNAAKGGAL